MSTYIYLKNYYLEEIKTIVQEHLNSFYPSDSTLAVEVLMKNSRTYFIRFNEEFAFEELLAWVHTFHTQQPTNERLTVIEGYQIMNEIEYKYFFMEEDLYAINSAHQSYKVEHFEELVVTDLAITFQPTAIPDKNIHPMALLKVEQPSKKWWKFWNK